MSATELYRTYIIVQEPGCVPEKKRPMPVRFGTERMLMSLQLCRPVGTALTVCRVWERDIDVSSGPETLAIFRAMFPRLSKKAEQEVRAEHDIVNAKRAPIATCPTVGVSP